MHEEELIWWPAPPPWALKQPNSPRWPRQKTARKNDGQSRAREEKVINPDLREKHPFANVGRDREH
jgi:hypothetical protein